MDRDDEQCNYYYYYYFVFVGIDNLVGISTSYGLKGPKSE